MSFWPSDMAGKIADVIAAVAFVWSGVTASRGKATEKSVKGLRHDFERRDLLPSAVENYQRLYFELSDMLRGPEEPHEAAQKIGELQGTLNTLEAYLEKTEGIIIVSIRKRIVLMEKEPNVRSHRLGLLQDASALSTELQGIVKRITWNSHS